MKITYLLPLLTLLVCQSGRAAAVDLNTWTVQNSTTGAGNWAVSVDGTTVLQTINGNPTVFLSPSSAQGTAVQGRIRVETTGDDDFIGFVLGFDNGDFADPLADYLLIDWKQANQAPGVDGLAVSRVTGAATTLNDFWQHTGVVTELARGATLGSTGWQDNVEYQFDFVFTPTNLQVSVNGNLEININGSFSDGNLGFYNYSQSTVRYSGFTQDPAPPTSTPEGGVGLGCLGVSFAGLMMLRRRWNSRRI
jgi:hypothetical protein